MENLKYHMVKKYSPKHLLRLIRRVQKQIPENDTLRHQLRHTEIKWEEVAFGPMDWKECKRVSLLLVRKVQRLQTLHGLLETAKEAITKLKEEESTTQKKQINKSKETPSVSSQSEELKSAYNSFLRQKLKDVPNDQKKECRISYLSEWRALSRNEKLSYLPKHRIRNIGPNPPPSKLYNFYMGRYMKSLDPTMNKQEIFKLAVLAWRGLSEEEKSEQQRLWQKAQRHYAKRYQAFLESLSPEERKIRLQFDSNKEETKSKRTSSKVASKKMSKERKMTGELQKEYLEQKKKIKELVRTCPLKPPTTLYHYFVRRFMKAKAGQLHQNEMFKAASQAWKNITEDNRAKLKHRMEKMQERYKKMHATYLNTFQEEKEKLDQLEKQFLLKSENIGEYSKSAQDVSTDIMDGAVNDELVEPGDIKKKKKRRKTLTTEENEESILENSERQFLLKSGNISENSASAQDVRPDFIVEGVSDELVEPGDITKKKKKRRKTLTTEENEESILEKSESKSAQDVSTDIMDGAVNDELVEPGDITKKKKKRRKTLTTEENEESILEKSKSKSVQDVSTDIMDGAVNDELVEPGDITKKKKKRRKTLTTEENEESVLEKSESKSVQDVSTDIMDGAVNEELVEPGDITKKKKKRRKTLTTEENEESILEKRESKSAQDVSIDIMDGTVNDELVEPGDITKKKKKRRKTLTTEENEESILEKSESASVQDFSPGIIVGVIDEELVEPDDISKKKKKRRKTLTTEENEESILEKSESIEPGQNIESTPVAPTKRKKRTQSERETSQENNIFNDISHSDNNDSDINVEPPTKPSNDSKKEERKSKRRPSIAASKKEMSKEKKMEKKLQKEYLEQKKKMKELVRTCPSKPPTSLYHYFKQSFMKAKAGELRPTEMFKAASQAWKDVTENERDKLKRHMDNMQERYKRMHATYLYDYHIEKEKLDQLEKQLLQKSGNITENSLETEVDGRQIDVTDQTFEDLSPKKKKRRKTLTTEENEEIILENSESHNDDNDNNNKVEAPMETANNNEDNENHTPLEAPIEPPKAPMDLFLLNYPEMTLQDWTDLPEKKKRHYNTALKRLQQNFMVKYESYLESLPRENLAEHVLKMRNESWHV